MADPPGRKSGGLARLGGSACGGKTVVPIMEKGFVYVLRCADDKLYIGSTRDIENRVRAHNVGKVKTTKSRRPVKLIHIEEMPTYTDARKRELYLKSGTGREWLRNNLEEWLSGRKRRS